MTLYSFCKTLCLKTSISLCGHNHFEVRFSSFFWSCAGLRVPVCSGCIQTGQSLASGMPGSHHGGAPVPISQGGAWRKLLQAGRCEKEREWSFLTKHSCLEQYLLVKFCLHLTFFKGTLWFFWRRPRPVWLLSLQNSSALSYFYKSTWHIYIITL